MAKNKALQREAAKRHYKKNRKKIIDRAAAHKKTTRCKIKVYITQIKQQARCESCGIQDYRVLDFHHTGKKSANIGEAANLGWSLKRVQLEIEKCRILCSNCHRILHYEKNFGGVEQADSSSDS